MNKPARHAISPRREENYPEWYQQVIKAADLAENSPVRGCMVIKPWGYAIWELIQKNLDALIKETGHENAYFPLLIPLSFMEKEAAHVEGFAKECAVVTHHRLEADSNGKLIPAGPLQEPYIIRPTSETIIGHFYSKWVNSYRDLPILINQWANVMRWEMRPRLFLRTTEFLWQEGHTVHATSEEAQEETTKMLDVYADFVERYLAMPVVKGRKTASERFPGAEETFTIEAMMQDGKALQAGTSHFLGQNFAKSSEIKFLDADGVEKYAWTTSWGVTTRMIGGLLMTHADDDGLVLPPMIAPRQIVILPIHKGETESTLVRDYCRELMHTLTALTFNGEKLRVALDDRDLRGGEKAWSWIKKGVPLRLEIGPKEVREQTVCWGRRDEAGLPKQVEARASFMAQVVTLLAEIQAGLYQRALALRHAHTREINSIADFEAFFSESQGTVDGGFALCHFDDAASEHELLKAYKVSPRCLPLPQNGFSSSEEAGTCLFTGKSTKQRVILAKSY